MVPLTRSGTGETDEGPPRAFCLFPMHGVVVARVLCLANVFGLGVSPSAPLNERRALALGGRDGKERQRVPGLLSFPSIV